MMFDRSRKLLAILHRVALGGAWLFAVGSLAALLLIMWLRWPSTSSWSAIMSTTVDGTRHSPVGLTYAGVPGTVLLWSQALVLGAVIILSVLSAKRFKRLGHTILIGWSVLWLGNALWLSQVGDGLAAEWLALAAILGVLSLCTVYRAVRCWPGQGTRSPRQVVEIAVAAGEDHADAPL